jgi:hypothetical protein
VVFSNQQFTYDSIGCISKAEMSPVGIQNIASCATGSLIFCMSQLSVARTWRVPTRAVEYNLHSRLVAQALLPGESEETVSGSREEIGHVNL